MSTLQMDPEISALLIECMRVLGSGEKWFKSEVEKWRSLCDDGDNIDEELKTETICFSRRPKGNLDEFMQLIAQVRETVSAAALAGLENEKDPS